MRTLTHKQTQELERIKYFIPSCMHHLTISDNDIREYFEWSDEGKHKDKYLDVYKMDGLHALFQGKRWQGIQLMMWEDGVLDGLGYISFLDKDTPRVIVDFIKKEMFKGVDAEIIENFYQDCLCS